MKLSLTGMIYEEKEVESEILSRKFLTNMAVKFLSRFNLKISTIKPYEAKLRKEGLDWPKNAHTMIGLKRLDNLQYCIEEIIKNNVPGDLIETGVWRGGACIFMKAVLKAYDVINRTVWCADSFKGLPEGKYLQDREVPFYSSYYLKVPLSEVKDNFRRYKLLDKNVKFLKGWFKDTLPRALITKLAVLRIDGDLYESTYDSLRYLYPKLSCGGYVILDDFDSIQASRKAVIDFRKTNGIKEKILKIDSSGVYWKKRKRTKIWHQKIGW